MAYLKLFDALLQINNMSELKERVAAALRGEAPSTQRRFAVDGASHENFPADNPAVKTSYTPYEYQRAAAVLIDAAYGVGEEVGSPPANIVVASPTGSGKTFLIRWAATRAVETGQKLVVAVP